MESKRKRGRPTKYNIQMIKRVTEYTKKCIKEGVFPTIEGLAPKLKIGVRSIYEWEELYPDFSQTIDNLRDTQKQLLITNGLVGKYNTRFSMFLLKANHGMSEKEPLVDATQNNYMNISPELMVDALKLMRSQDGQ